MHYEPAGGDFETTRATLMARLKADTDEMRRAALEELSRLYLGPVFHYVRRCGKGRDEAEEVTQAFFTEKILAGKLFERANPTRGHLRSLIKTALAHFMTDLHRVKSKRRERTLDSAAIEREEHLLRTAPQDPGEALDKRASLEYMEETKRRVEQHYRAKRLDGHWELFVARYIQPVERLIRGPSLQAAACVNGFSSAAAAASAVQQVRKFFLTAYQRVVAEQVDDPEAVEAECAYLNRLLRG